MSDAIRLGQGGGRIAWTDVPAAVRAAIEREAGGRVVSAQSQPGGFSPGLAVRVRLDDGGALFVKAAGGAPDAEASRVAVRFHRREARIASALPAAVPAPRLRFAYDDGAWVALGFDDVDGRHPAIPWVEDELARVVAAVDELGELLTPSPIDAPAAGPVVARLFCGWRDLASDAARLDRAGPWVRRHLDRLRELEAACPDAAAGDTLLHFDVRADNVLLAGDRVFLVDWPHARVGVRWLDRLLMLPSVAMQGGPPPWELWADGAAAADAVTAMVAGFGGYLTAASLLPPPPGIPHLREFQALQAGWSLDWLRRRTGWR